DWPGGATRPERWHQDRKVLPEGSAKPLCRRSRRRWRRCREDLSLAQSLSAEILGCLGLNKFFFRLAQHVRHDVDATEMIVDSFDAGNTFRSGDEGWALAWFGNRAPQIDLALAHRDVDKSNGRPRLLCELSQ